MKTAFQTYIKDINISQETKDFWDNQIIKPITNLPIVNYGFNDIKTWDDNFKYSKKQQFKELFRDLSFMHRSSKDEIKKNCLIFLELLSKDGHNITEVIKETISVNKSLAKNDYTNHVHIDMTYFNIYYDYLNYKNQIVPKEIFECFTKDILQGERNRNYSDMNSCAISFFELMSVSNPNWVNEKNIEHALTYITTQKDEDIGEYISYPEGLEHKSQKLIKNYILEHFPISEEKFSKYFKNIYKSKLFDFEKLYQGTLTINLAHMFEQYSSSSYDTNTYKAQLITEECANVVSKEDFLKLINKDYLKIKTINAKKENNFVEIKYATEQESDVEEFKKILQTSLLGVYPLFETIHISSSDNYHGSGESIFTNMKIDMIYKAYRSQSLEENLDVKPTKKISKKL